MMKLVFTFFLPLCFLLSSGHHQLYTPTDHHPAGYGPAKLSDRSEQAGLDNEKSSQSFIRKSGSSGSENDVINATEMEDDDYESLASRKHVEISDYFITLFYAQVAGDFYRYLKNRLPVCKHFSYISSYKYILHRVIRV